MYLALLGPSSTSFKTTSQRIAMKVFPQNKLHPNDFSPEQFLVELSENPANFLSYGEFTYMLKAVGKSGYMGRMTEILNDIFDCPEKYVRKLREKKDNNNEFVINNAYLSLVTTCTNEMMEKYVNNEMMNGGFLARFLIIEGDKNIKPRRRMNPLVNIYAQDLRKKLEWIGKVCSNNKHRFIMTDDCLQRYNEIEQELFEYDEISPFVGRYLNYIISIADIIAVSDALGDYKANELDKLDKLNKLDKLDELAKTNIANLANKANSSNSSRIGDIKITNKYVNEAYKMIKPCLNSVKSLSYYVDVSIPVKKLEKVIKNHSPIDYSTAMRYSRLHTREMQLAISTLKAQEKINVEKEERIVHGKNRPKVEVYTWIG